MQYDICQETFSNLAIESVNKVIPKKKKRGQLQRRKHLNEKLVSKQEININNI